MDNQMVILIIQTATLVTMVLTFIVYYFQLRALRHSSRGQHFLALIQHLQAPEVRTAREIVLNDLRTKPFKEWDRTDREAASTVCASYGNAGVLVRVGLVEFELLQSWGPSVIRCYEVCAPLVAERQAAAGSDYWKDLVELHG
jgi:hypothetical protein